MRQKVTAVSAAFSTMTLTGVLAVSGAASAQTRSQVYGDDLTKQSQTFYIRGDVQATTHDSEVAASKDTSETNYLTVGAWAGEGRIIGIEFTSADVDAKFQSEGFSSDNSFRDVRLMTRLGWLIPSVGASLTELDIKSGDTSEVSIYGTGINAGLKVAVPVTMALVVHAEGSLSQPTKSYDKLLQGSKLGSRSDADIGASYDLTERMVDVLFGYKIRSYEIETAERKYQEGMSGAYAGLRLGVYF
jgi:hypothetical protein